MASSSMFTIILPTYNERENLERFVGALQGVFRDNRLNGRILVVDDGSPDGTGQIADELAGRYRNLAVLHRRRKQGIGPAYVAGFKEALKTGADFIFEMDCDFSHDPADIPRMLAAAGEADLVLGSRYVAGGQVKNWGPLRRLISHGGGIYASLVLGIPIHDLTAGFKCFRRQVLEALDLNGVSSSGYGFQIELTFKAIRKGFRVKEIPVSFTDRELGTSKMSMRIVLEAAVMVWRLRLGLI